MYVPSSNHQVLDPNPSVRVTSTSRSLRLKAGTQVSLEASEVRDTTVLSIRVTNGENNSLVELDDALDVDLMPTTFVSIRKLHKISDIVKAKLNPLCSVRVMLASDNERPGGKSAALNFVETQEALTDEFPSEDLDSEREAGREFWVEEGVVFVVTVDLPTRKFETLGTLDWKSAKQFFEPNF